MDIKPDSLDEIFEIADDVYDQIGNGEESRTLDYKAPSRWSEKNKRECCELAKDILAMANTAGGAIVIGVTEDKHEFTFCGIDPADIVTWESTRLNNFVNRYADPPINCRLVVKEFDGRKFVIITVPAFNFTPHITIKDYPGTLNRATLYVRTANNASAPIENAVDFNSIVERAIKVRRGEMLEAIVVILPELEAALEGRLQQLENEGWQRSLLRRAGRATSVLRGAQILWIDDAPENNIHERRILRTLGVFVDLARSSDSAADMLIQTEYDLVISDIRRDGQDDAGLEFFNKQLSHRPYPPTIFYINEHDQARGTPAYSFAITNRPDELLHFIIDALERTRS